MAEIVAKEILGTIEPITDPPEATLTPVVFNAAREELQAKIQRNVGDEELLSWLLYPDVFLQFAETQWDYGDVSGLPSPVFFYGLREEEEIAVDIEPGKTLIIRQLASVTATRRAIAKSFSN